MNGDSLLAGLTRHDASEVEETIGLESVISPTTSLVLPLLTHQQEGMERALAFGSTLCSDDMGLGKTGLGIGVTASAIEAGLRPILWVVPPSLRTNTVREFSKFAPHLTTHVVVGQKPSCLPDVDVVIVGDSVVSHWEETLVSHGIGGLVADGAHGSSRRLVRLGACALVLEIRFAVGVSFGVIGVGLKAFFVGEIEVGDQPPRDP
jgi:hypothetical protein